MKIIEDIDFCMDKQRPETILRKFLLRNACFRAPDRCRVKFSGTGVYKKGYEVRFCLKNRTELFAVKRSLRRMKCRPGREYTLTNRYILPIYGREYFVKMRSLVRKRRRTN